MLDHSVSKTFRQAGRIKSNLVHWKKDDNSNNPQILVGIKWNHNNGVLNRIIPFMLPFKPHNKSKKYIGHVFFYILYRNALAYPRLYSS